jgi:predicted Holliday junction resolvase-like endonuclease
LFWHEQARQAKLREKERLAAAEPLDGRQVSEIREEACRAGVHVLLGSVSERVAHKAASSVLVVRPVR